MSNSLRPHNLSPREIEVIQLIADGLTDKEIAARLCITTRTVADHIINIRSKLGAANRASAVFQYFYKSMSQRAQAEAARAHAAQESNMNTHCTLRPADAAKDAAEFAPTAYQITASTWLGSDSFLSVTTEQAVLDALTEGMAHPKHRFVVAEDAQGQPLGYSQLYQEPWSHPEGRILNINIKQDMRGRARALHCLQTPRRSAESKA